jgi:hypothetical protein
MAIFVGRKTPENNHDIQPSYRDNINDFYFQPRKKGNVINENLRQKNDGRIKEYANSFEVEKMSAKEIEDLILNIHDLNTNVLAELVGLVTLAIRGKTKSKAV